VLNTSFNDNEPIVCNLRSDLTAFLRTQMARCAWVTFLVIHKIVSDRATKRRRE